MIGAKVDVRTGWGAEFAREINLKVADAIADASKVGAETAAAAAQTRRRTGKMADIDPVPVRGTPDGWEGGFRSAAFYSKFQSRGTTRGVRPLRHEEKGLRAAKADLVERLNRLGPRR